MPAGKASIQFKEDRNKEKRYYCNDRFSVYSIQYNADREISGLTIINGSGQTVYELKVGKDTRKDKEKAQPKEKQRKGAQEGTLTREQMVSLQAELDRTGVAMEAVQERYKIKEPGNMGSELYNKVMAALSKTKSANAA